MIAAALREREAQLTQMTEYRDANNAALGEMTERYNALVAQLGERDAQVEAALESERGAVEREMAHLLGGEHAATCQFCAIEKRIEGERDAALAQVEAHIDMLAREQEVRRGLIHERDAARAQIEKYERWIANIVTWRDAHPDVMPPVSEICAATEEP